MIPNMINRPQMHQWFSCITGSVGPITFQMCFGVRNFTEISVAPRGWYPVPKYVGISCLS